MLSPIDPALNRYLRAAKRRTTQAFRPATQRNQGYILRMFVRFANKMRQPHTHPTPALVLAYIEYIARKQKTAASVISTFTTLKALLNRMEINILAFSHPKVDLMLRAIKINKRTPATQRPPMSVPHLRLVLSRLQAMEYGHQLVVAILIMFTTNFRQSNVAPPSTKKFDHTRHLLRTDIRLTATSVQVYQKWSKTQQQVTMDRWITIPRASSDRLCLVTAITRLFHQDPTVRRRQPLITFEDGNPLPIPYIYRAFKLALRQAGLTNMSYTLQSLRRGGATYLQRAGVNLPEIASHGGWRSNAIFRYVQPPHRRAAFRALQALS